MVRRGDAYREAGHALAAWHHSIMLNTVSIFRSRRAANRNVWNNVMKNVDLDWVRTNDSSNLVERLAAVCLAGPVAQRMHDAKGPRGPKYKRKIDEARLLLNAVPPDLERGGERFLRLSREAERFFKKAKVEKTLKAVAEALVDRGAMAGDEITRLIEAHYAR